MASSLSPLPSCSHSVVSIPLASLKEEGNPPLFPFRYTTTTRGSLPFHYSIGDSTLHLQRDAPLNSSAPVSGEDFKFLVSRYTFGEMELGCAARRKSVKIGCVYRRRKQGVRGIVASLLLLLLCRWRRGVAAIINLTLLTIRIEARGTRDQQPFLPSWWP